MALAATSVAECGVEARVAVEQLFFLAPFTSRVVAKLNGLMHRAIQLIHGYETWVATRNLGRIKQGCFDPQNHTSALGNVELYSKAILTIDNFDSSTADAQRMAPNHALLGPQFVESSLLGDEEGKKERDLKTLQSSLKTLRQYGIDPFLVSDCPGICIHAET